MDTERRKLRKVLDSMNMLKDRQIKKDKVKNMISQSKLNATETYFQIMKECEEYSELLENKKGVENRIW